MYTPNSTYVGRQRALFRETATKNLAPIRPIAKKDRVADELKVLGVSKWGMMLSASRYLHRVIHEDEHLKAVVYGKHEEGLAMLVATDLRIIFLNKKPMYIKSDELTYDIVSGIKYGNTGLSATLTLHTRISDYALRTMNLKCAARFRDFIQQRCLERANPAYDVW